MRHLLWRATESRWATTALESFSGNRGGLLCALRASDGAKIWQGELHSVPVFDGLIAAHGRLYLSLQDGAVTSLRGSDSS